MEKITKKTVQRMTQQLHEKNMERLRRKLLLNNNSEILNDFMIRCRQYDISILEKNINNLSLKTLLYTQKLTADFCAKYILNEKTFYKADVLNAQKHITEQELFDAIDKLNKIEIYF
jgi:hypothetical protein